MLNFSKSFALSDCRVGFSPPIPTKFSILHSKFLLFLCTCALVLFNIAAPAHAKYGGGAGEPNDPYLIYDANQMNAIGADSNDWNKHFRLMADIDLSAYTGTSFNIIGYWVDLDSPDNKPFTGVFDGSGHTISNFSYASIGTGYIGLFGYVDDPNAEIKNLGLIDPNVDTGTGFRVGSLVGWFRDGTIANCYAEAASVTGDRWVGGLVGSNSGTISNCYSIASVSGSEDTSNTAIGGLVGLNYEGTISNCYSIASVSGINRVGGLVGGNSWSSTISNCYSTGDVSGDENVGGLAGSNYLSTITNCYSTCSVLGDRSVGGLLGKNYYRATITNCYSTGTVTGTTEVGGLVGSNHYDSKIISCYSTGTVTGTTEVGGLVGRNIGYIVLSYWDIEASGVSESDGGEGKSTAEMKSMSTYYGWGYGAAWTIDEGVDYPRLVWENAPGVPIEDPLHKYGGGGGTVSDPYLIYKAEHLNTIGIYPADFACHFKLMADIDLSGFPGSEFNIIGYVIGFSGVFDGNAHTISNFSYTSTDKRDIGLFGIVSGVNAEIRNLGLIDPNVDAGTRGYVGSLVGLLRVGTITNCYVEGGSVVGEYRVGGLVGYNENGTISNCYATGSVFGNQYVGGLVGYNDNSIVDCYTSGNVTGGDNSYCVGGLCGKSTGPSHGTAQSRIQNCFNKATVTGNTLIGGLIGHSGAIVTGCYSTGSVTGKGDYSWSIGGLIGSNGGNGSINNCYSTGSVVGDGDGGLVGYNEGTVSASFWDIETSGQTTSAGGMGLTTAQMQMAITFVCWGYEPVWTINEGNDYPRLWWENKPGELITVPSDLYGGGTGEPKDPYLIYTAEQLNKIGLNSCHLDKHFRLMADVDLGGFTGTSFNIIGIDYSNPFSGVFDGNGSKIFNFIYTSTGRSNIGLFGCINDPNAEVKNLGLIDTNVDVGTEYYVGSLVGQLDNGTISNCYIEGGSVDGRQYVGGLVGRNNWGSITNSYSTCIVSGYWFVGGLVGYHYRNTITNSYSTGSVSGDQYVGGLVGRNRNGTITSCYAAGDVSSEHAYTGGLVGYNQYSSKINNCYSTGSVTGTTNVGGLVGDNEGTITNCYSSGSVAGTGWSIGGLVGRNAYYGQVMHSFWDIETSGQTSSKGGTGLPTDQMQMKITFTDAVWDFVVETFNGIEDIWFIPQQDYPHLWWEGMQVPMKLTPRTLNCRSKGNWVKAHLTLPEGFTVADVDSNRPAVLHSFGFQSLPLYVSVNENELVQIEAAFEREAVCSLTGDWPEALTVAGFLTDGNIFLGTSTVRMIAPGLKDIEELALYWLNADCVHPDFCDGIDLNRDSMVNLLDYALLLNSQVEFVSE